MVPAILDQSGSDQELPMDLIQVTSGSKLEGENLGSFTEGAVGTSPVDVVMCTGLMERA
jgi:hypothetical protein